MRNHHLRAPPCTTPHPQVCDALGVVYIEEDLRRHEPRGRASSAGGAAPADAPHASAATNNNAGSGDEAMSGEEEGDDDNDEGGSYAGDEDGGGSGSDDEAMEEQSSEDEDRDLMVECGKRQGMWERHEQELIKVGGAGRQLGV